MKPRLSRILWTDWPALFCAIVIPVMWLLYFLFPFMKRGVQPFAPHLLWLASSTSFLAAAVLVWRVMRIDRLFRRGQVTPGRVTRIQIVKDRGRVEFAYELLGRSFESWAPVHKNRRILALRTGQEVAVLVDPTRPTRAIIRELYT